MMPTKRMYNNDQNWLPTFFNDFFDNDWMMKTNATAPAINVVESDKDYKVEVAAPGMKKEDFNIHLGDNNELIITMEQKNENKEEHNKYLRREFAYSKFQQSFVLPDNIEKESTLIALPRKGEAWPIWTKISGRVTKSSPGPDSGSMPLAKTAGIIANPAMMAKIIEEMAVQTPEVIIFSFLLT